MPFKASRPCSIPGCGKPARDGGKCEEHQRQQRKYSDDRRGSATARGYGAAHQKRFRPGVLERDGHTCQVCGGHATVADHYPHSRRELVAMGLDPDDPQYGRALCTEHHNQHTGRTQGWMAKPSDAGVPDW